MIYVVLVMWVCYQETFRWKFCYWPEYYMIIAWFVILFTLSLSQKTIEINWGKKNTFLSKEKSFLKVISIKRAIDFLLLKVVIYVWFNFFGEFFILVLCTQSCHVSFDIRNDGNFPVFINCTNAGASLPSNIHNLILNDRLLSAVS